MSLGLFEPDRLRTNLTIVGVLLFLIAVFFGYSLLGYNGCEHYSDKLATCEPFRCVQKLKGFENSYGAPTITKAMRQIVGFEADPYFDRKFCHVYESDDVRAKDAFECMYTPKTLPDMAARSALIFGEKEELSMQGKTAAQKAKMRLKYLERTPAQKIECKKISW